MESVYYEKMLFNIYMKKKKKTHNESVAHIKGLTFKIWSKRTTDCFETQARCETVEEREGASTGSRQQLSIPWSVKRQ